VTDARRQTGGLLSVDGAVSVPLGGGGAAHDRWIQAENRGDDPDDDMGVSDDDETIEDADTASLLLSALGAELIAEETNDV